MSLRWACLSALLVEPASCCLVLLWSTTSHLHHAVRVGRGVMSSPRGGPCSIASFAPARPGSADPSPASRRRGGAHSLARGARAAQGAALASSISTMLTCCSLRDLRSTGITGMSAAATPSGPSARPRHAARAALAPLPALPPPPSLLLLVAAQAAVLLAAVGQWLLRRLLACAPRRLRGRGRGPAAVRRPNGGLRWRRCRL